MQEQIPQQQEEVNFVPISQGEVKGRPQQRPIQQSIVPQAPVKGRPSQNSGYQQQQIETPQPIQQSYGGTKGESKKGQSSGGYNSGNSGFQGIKGDSGYRQPAPVQQPIIPQAPAPVKGRPSQNSGYQQQQQQQQPNSGYGGTKQMTPEQIQYARREPVKPAR